MRRNPGYTIGIDYKLLDLWFHFTAMMGKRVPNWDIEEDISAWYALKELTKKYESATLN